MTKRGEEMIRIAICDDVTAEQERMKSLLVQTSLFDSAEFAFFKNGNDIIGSYDKGERYDLVFLDVDMPEVNGIEAGKHINSIDEKAILIFITNCPQYAVDAFDCNAFHYLLKDSSPEKFRLVITNAYESYKRRHRTIILSTKEGQVTVNVDDVYYVECCRKHLYFYTENEKYVTSDTLSQVCDMLSPLGFYRVHQGYIVNFEKVASVSGTEITLQNRMKVSMSVRKKQEVLKAYSNYVSRMI